MPFPVPVFQAIFFQKILPTWITSHWARFLAEHIQATSGASSAGTREFYRFQRQERGFSSERILQGLRHIYIDGLKAPSATAGRADEKPTV